MAKKRRNLFLYLTLACFLGLIVIFVADGYMGVYDTFYLTTGEYEQKIGSESWLRQDRYMSVGADWGDKIFFRYELDNRRFSRYETDIDVSVWRSQEKVSDLLSQQISVNGFKNSRTEWIVDTAELLPADASPEQRYQYTVIVKRGEIERRIIINTNYVPKPVIPVTAP